MTKTKVQDLYAKGFYATLGIGEVLYERSLDLAQKAAATTEARRKDAVRLYGEFAERGERLVKKAKTAKPAKRVTDNARQAQRQLKGAVTSVRKALGAEEEKPAKETG